MSKIVIRVPATSANMGPGFDSIGVAFKVYLTVIVEEQTNRWRVNHALGTDVPTDEKNLIVQTALKVNPQLEPHQLTVMSDIPVARGLGSSSTAIVAGIKMANELAEMNLSLAEQLNIGAKIEGHPDNVAPAIFGDVVVANFDGEKTSAIKLAMPDLSALAFIKPERLLTKDSRNVLADTMTRAQAVTGSSVANVFVAALATGDFDTASKMMEKDEFHETARTKLVPELPQIRDVAAGYDLRGTYLSGAGPTIVTFGPELKLTVLRQKLTDLGLKGSMRILEIDRTGATVSRD